jgi:hypothetical protein
MARLPILCVIYSNQCSHCNKYKDGSALAPVRGNKRLQGIVMIEKDDPAIEEFEVDYFPTVFLQFPTKSILFGGDMKLNDWINSI